jgi:hypothetical protein
MRLSSSFSVLSKSHFLRKSTERRLSLRSKVYLVGRDFLAMPWPSPNTATNNGQMITLAAWWILSFVNAGSTNMMRLYLMALLACVAVAVGGWHLTFGFSRKALRCARDYLRFKASEIN